MQQSIDDRIDFAYRKRLRLQYRGFTQREIATLNRRLRGMARLADARRMAVEKAFVSSISRDVEGPLKATMRAMVNTGAADSYARLIESEYLALKRKRTGDGEAAKELRARMLDDNSALRRELLTGIRDAASSAGVNLMQAYNNFLALFVLYDYNAAYSLNSVLLTPKNCVTLCRADLAAMSKSVTNGFSIEDWTFINAVTQRAYPEVENAITDRDNKITLAGFTDSVFDELADTMNRDIYKRKEGALGAEALSKHFEEVLNKKYPQMAATIPQHKYKLWARTEGAVIQGDALMRVGKDNDMDGKQWVAIVDDVTRDAHVLNDSDGVIPMEDKFSDGSTDAGSGSESPFNCRCVCGPALLSDEAKAARDKKTKKPKPTKKVEKPKAVEPKPPTRAADEDFKPVPFKDGKKEIKVTGSQASEETFAKVKPKHRVQTPDYHNPQGINDEVGIGDAIDHYSGTGFEKINKAMRKGTPEVLRGEAKATMDTLIDYFKNVDNPLGAYTKKELTVYRGLSFNSNAARQKFLGDVREGVLMREAGFVSTTADWDIATGFAQDKKVGVLLEVQVPSRTKIAFGTQYGEAEMLLANGSAFEVTGVSVVDDIARVKVKLKHDVGKARAYASLPDTPESGIVPFTDPSKELTPALRPKIDPSDVPARNTFDSVALQPDVKAYKEARAYQQTIVDEMVEEGVKKYTAGSNLNYKKMNGYLRGKVDKLDDDLLQLTNALTDYFDSADITKALHAGDDLVVFRGLAGDSRTAKALAKAKPGFVFSDGAFVSTSVDVNVADRFLLEEWGGGVRVKYEIPKGTRMLVGNVDEKEIILGNGQAWKITKVETASGQDILEVTVEAFTPDDAVAALSKPVTKPKAVPKTKKQTLPKAPKVTDTQTPPDFDSQYPESFTFDRKLAKWEKDYAAQLNEDWKGAREVLRRDALGTFKPGDKGYAHEMARARHTLRSLQNLNQPVGKRVYGATGDTADDVIKKLSQMRDGTLVDPADLKAMKLLDAKMQAAESKFDSELEAYVRSTARVPESDAKDNAYYEYITSLRAKIVDPVEGEIITLSQKINAAKQAGGVSTEEARKVIYAADNIDVADLPLDVEALKDINADAADEIARIFDRELMEGKRHFNEVGAVPKSGARATFEADGEGGGEIQVAFDAHAKTIIHEFGHAIEHDYNYGTLLSRYRDARGGKETVNLGAFTGQTGYGPFETAKPDKFFHPYVGKMYFDDTTELLAMGVEKLYADPIGFAKADPEMFSLIWEISKGLI